jgi:hypothetical protein
MRAEEHAGKSVYGNGCKNNKIKFNIEKAGRVLVKIPNNRF